MHIRSESFDADTVHGGSSRNHSRSRLQNASAGHGKQRANAVAEQACIKHVHDYKIAALLADVTAAFDQTDVATSHAHALR